MNVQRFPLSANHGGQPGLYPGVFQIRGGFLKQGHFEKHFSYNKQKKGLMGENLFFFQLGNPFAVVACVTKAS